MKALKSIVTIIDCAAILVCFFTLIIFVSQLLRGGLHEVGKDISIMLHHHEWPMLLAIVFSVLWCAIFYERFDKPGSEKSRSRFGDGKALTRADRVMSTHMPRALMPHDMESQRARENDRFQEQLAAKPHRDEAQTRADEITAMKAAKSGSPLNEFPSSGCQRGEPLADEKARLCRALGVSLPPRRPEVASRNATPVEKVAKATHEPGTSGAPLAIFDMQNAHSDLYKSHPAIWNAGSPENLAFVQHARKNGLESAYRNAHAIMDALNPSVKPIG